MSKILNLIPSLTLFLAAVLFLIGLEPQVNLLGRLLYFFLWLLVGFRVYQLFKKDL